MDRRSGMARVDYSPQLKQLQVTVPKGFKYKDVAGLNERVLSGEILEKLRHGCAECLSGIPVIIKEEFDHEVNVDLESMQVIGR